MSWRMHIAVLNTEKAQKIRVLPAEHYKKMAGDWIQVEQIACNHCEKASKDDYVGDDIINAIENELNISGLLYDKKKLVEFVHYIADGPYKVDECFESDFTQFHHFVEEDMGVTEDYCLGRFDDIPKDIGNPFYVNEETQNLFEYYNPRVIYKKDFEWIIGMFRKLIIEQYKERLLDPNKALRWQGVIEAKLDLWESPYVEPYNMDENQKCIVRAYDLEYQIFDLVRMYKSIDWMRDTVVFFGW